MLGVPYAANFAGRFLIYGADGYTGRLIARAAVEHDLRPILAGRRRTEVERLAGQLGAEYRVFGLTEPQKVDEGLSGVSLVLDCAGPFVNTSRPMVDACLRQRVHYLDITGEVPVLESLAQRNDEAVDCGIMLLPGVGFDVVPSDCLAAHVKQRLPSAVRLSVGIYIDGAVSRGTLRTVLEHFPRGAVVRRNGRLKSVPLAWRTRDFPLGDRFMTGMTVPLGDVTTAYHTTAIPNIDVYMVVPAPVVCGTKLWSPIAPLFGCSPLRSVMAAFIDASDPGPSPAERERGRAVLWAEAMDESGRRVLSRLDTVDGYALTVQTSIAIVRQVFAGTFEPGFQTPAGLLSSDFILDCSSAKRADIY